MLNSSFDGITGNTADFHPEPLHGEIDAVNERIYHTVNNGVYKSGFATTQDAYEEAVTALIDARRETVIGRFFLGDDSDAWSGGFRFPIGSATGLLQRALSTNAPVWFDARHAPATAGEVGAELHAFCSGNGCMLAPIRLARRTVACLYADRAPSARPIDDEDYASFCHFAQQVTLCLSLIGRQRD